MIDEKETDGLKLSKLFDVCYQRHFGFLMTTGKLKPVHLANGMFRHMLGGCHDIEAIVAEMHPVRKSRGNNIGTPNEISKKTKRVLEQAFKEFEGTRTNGKSVIVSTIREALDVEEASFFGMYDRSSIAISTASMVSADRQDRWLGSFIGSLFDGTELKDRVVSLLKREYNPPADPLTCLAIPLLDTADLIPKKDVIRLGETHVPSAEVLDAFRKAAHNLHSHENEMKSNLLTLQRVVLLGFLGMIMQLRDIGRNADGLRHPLLLCMNPSSISPVTQASTACFDNWMRSAESFLSSKLIEDLLKQGIFDGPNLPRLPRSLSDEDMREYVGKFEATKGKAQHSAKTMETRMQFVRSARAMHEATETETNMQVIAAVLGDALADMYLAEADYSGPRRLVEFLGGKAGMFYPRTWARREKRRLHASPALLEVMVMCCHARGESISGHEMAERLYETFGFVTGYGDSDSERLQDFRIDVERNLLTNNGAEFMRALEIQGMARVLADGVATVGGKNGF